ncbi:MAG: PfkB family carbohydrate kinase, partial [Treponema sp.]|nr:PfkB family carbohydrate kinase [Treponema sp.]
SPPLAGPYLRYSFWFYSQLPVADTIGAGDTFHRALLARLEMQKKLSPSAIAALTEAELYDAVYFANRAASLVCSVPGADPPSLVELEAGTKARYT